MNQTPASKRFLPPSSSARTQRPPSTAKTGHFTRASQANSSSPFLRTPFSNTAQERDDIETSFDDDEAASPLAASIQPTSTVSMPSKSDRAEDHGTANVTPNKPAIRLQNPRTSLRNGDSHLNEVYDDGANLSVADFSSPLPKRQKRKHVHDEPIGMVPISSSPAGDAEIPGDVPSDLDFDDMQGDEADEIEDAGSMRTKFRAPTTTGLDTQNEHARQSLRSAFKGVSTSGTSWAATPLPATFSPSKRRGKFDYVYGGAAETVRGWILDIANEQSKSSNASMREVYATTSMTDVSGRFEIVVDEEGDDWMLVHQDNQKVLSRGEGAGEQRQRAFSIKGSATSWSIETRKEGAEGPANKLNVAVLWESVDTK